MSAGPLRRLLAVLGLLALGPIAYQLLVGAITVGDAAVRAVAVLAVVLVLGAVSRLWLGEVARGYERDGDQDASASGPAGAAR